MSWPHLALLSASGLGTVEVHPHCHFQPFSFLMTWNVRDQHFQVNAAALLLQIAEYAAALLLQTAAYAAPLLLQTVVAVFVEVFLECHKKYCCFKKIIHYFYTHEMNNTYHSLTDISNSVSLASTGEDSREVDAEVGLIHLLF